MRSTMAAAPSANIETQIAALEGRTSADLPETHYEVSGEDRRSRRKDLLRKRIAWRLEANDEGDLAERARRRAAALASDFGTTSWRTRRLNSLLRRRGARTCQQASGRAKNALPLSLRPGRLVGRW